MKRRGQFLQLREATSRVCATPHSAWVNNLRREKTAKCQTVHESNPSKLVTRNGKKKKKKMHISILLPCHFLSTTLASAWWYTWKQQYSTHMCSCGSELGSTTRMSWNHGLIMLALHHKIEKMFETRNYEEGCRSLPSGTACTLGVSKAESRSRF